MLGNVDLAISKEGVLIDTLTLRGTDGKVLYVPEPATMTLSPLALAGLLARRRRKAVR